MFVQKYRAVHVISYHWLNELLWCRNLITNYARRDHFTSWESLNKNSYITSCMHLCMWGMPTYVLRISVIIKNLYYVNNNHAFYFICYKWVIQTLIPTYPPSSSIHSQWLTVIVSFQFSLVHILNSSICNIILKHYLHTMTTSYKYKIIIAYNK